MSHPTNASDHSRWSSSVNKCVVSTNSRVEDEQGKRQSCPCLFRTNKQKKIFFLFVVTPPLPIVIVAEGLEIDAMDVWSTDGGLCERLAELWHAGEQLLPSSVFVEPRTIHFLEKRTCSTIARVPHCTSPQLGQVGTIVLGLGDTTSQPFSLSVLDEKKEKSGNSATCIETASNCTILEWRATLGNLVAFYPDCGTKETPVEEKTGIRAFILFDVFSLPSGALDLSSSPRVPLDLGLQTKWEKYMIMDNQFDGARARFSALREVTPLTRFIRTTHALARHNLPFAASCADAAQCCHCHNNNATGANASVEQTCEKRRSTSIMCTRDSDDVNSDSQTQQSKEEKDAKNKKKKKTKKQNNYGNDGNGADERTANSNNNNAAHLKKPMQFGILLDRSYSLSPGPLVGGDARIAHFLDRVLVGGGWASSIDVIPVALDFNRIQDTHHDCEYGFNYHLSEDEDPCSCQVHAFTPDVFRHMCHLRRTRGTKWHVRKRRSENCDCDNDGSKKTTQLHIPFYHGVKMRDVIGRKKKGGSFGVPPFSIGDSWRWNHDAGGTNRAETMNEPESRHRTDDSVSLAVALIITLTSIEAIVASLSGLPFDLATLVADYARDLFCLSKEESNFNDPPNRGLGKASRGTSYF